MRQSRKIFALVLSIGATLGVGLSHGLAQDKLKFPVGVGTKWLASWSSAPKPVEVEMLEYDRPNRWVAHNGGLLEVNLTGRLEPEAGGVRLHVDFEARPHGLLRFFFPILLRKLRKGEAANMEHIRAALEG